MLKMNEPERYWKKYDSEWLKNSSFLPSVNKKERYQMLLPQIKALVEGEPDQVANLSNIAAALKQTMNFFWVGFYLVKENQLVLGPFQGPIACTRIDLRERRLWYSLEGKKNHSRT